MNHKTLKTKKEYYEALERFEEVFHAESGTNESDEADVVALTIKEYEDKNYVIDKPEK